MKKDPHIQRAIDESLSSVHFDARDMHRVMRGIRDPEVPRRAPAKARLAPLRLVMTTAMAALIIVPVSLLVLRAGSMRPTDIATITAQNDASPAVTAAVTPLDPLVEPASSPARLPALFTEDDAIACARLCFEQHCDTTIFTFDEYTVDVQADCAYGSDPSGGNYLVTMRSIYGNGCTFSVAVSPAGEILSYSTPRLATVPMHLSSESEEVRAWYDKYGAYLYTWPLDIQAEFSRRYEGGLLRAPREGDMSEAEILAIAQEHAREKFGVSDSGEITAYCSLISERASGDNQARYQVYCFHTSSPQVCLLLSMHAQTGEILSSESVSRDSL